MLQRYLIVWLVVVCGIAAVFHYKVNPDYDPFWRSKPLLPYLFAATEVLLGVLKPETRAKGRTEDRAMRLRFPRL